MNDCLWYFICDLCDAKNCVNCSKYLSANSEEGRQQLQEYNKEVEQVLLPLVEKWRNKMNEYTAN